MSSSSIPPVLAPSTGPSMSTEIHDRGRETESLIVAALERQGYRSQIGADGRIVATAALDPQLAAQLRGQVVGYLRTQAWPRSARSIAWHLCCMCAHRVDVDAMVQHVDTILAQLRVQGGVVADRAGFFRLAGQHAPAGGQPAQPRSVLQRRRAQPRGTQRR